MARAGKAYSSRAIRTHASTVSREPAGFHGLGRGSRFGRSPAFDHDAHQQRNAVGRSINR
ncbi:hypothetical protein C6376_35985 [Streptomyces sp. P3]|nr:hypothetical protein C6376_35985 [Streptomyces sp. P3]